MQPGYIVFCVFLVGFIYYNGAHTRAVSQAKQENGCIKSGHTEPLHVGAFNIQTFGRKKMAKPGVPEIIVQILVRYDLIQIQEIVDYKDTEAIEQLLDMVNQASGDAYHMELSDRQGRGTSIERYGFLYRHEKLSVLDSYQWLDEEDYFERPPFSVRFRAPDHAVGEFGYMGLHAKPSDAVSEINRLTHVYDEVSKMWDLEDFIIGGDLNAGCRYVSDSAWISISLRQDERFLWAIGDDADTTMAASQCPLDRFVLAGERMQGALVAGSAVPYRFELEMDITMALARNVSDHVPIDMYLS